MKGAVFIIKRLEYVDNLSGGQIPCLVESSGEVRQAPRPASDMYGVDDLQRGCYGFSDVDCRSLLGEKKWSKGRSDRTPFAPLHGHSSESITAREQ